MNAPGLEKSWFLSGASANPVVELSGSPICQSGAASPPIGIIARAATAIRRIEKRRNKRLMVFDRYVGPGSESLVQQWGGDQEFLQKNSRSRNKCLNILKNRISPDSGWRMDAISITEMAAGRPKSMATDIPSTRAGNVGVDSPGKADDATGSKRANQHPTADYRSLISAAASATLEALPLPSGTRNPVVDLRRSLTCLEMFEHSIYCTPVKR